MNVIIILNTKEGFWKSMKNKFIKKKLNKNLHVDIISKYNIKLRSVKDNAKLNFKIPKKSLFKTQKLAKIK